MTVGNVSMILFIIIAGLPYFDSDHFSDFAPRGAAGILGGASSVFFSYVGWDAVCVLSEEVEKPTVVIPRAIGVTISLTATLYALVSISLIGLVGVEQINPLTPIYSAFQYVGLDWAAIVVAVAAVTCSITATYGTSAGQPRVFYRMGKDGLLSPKFTKVNSKGSPFYGIFWTLILTVIISALLDFDILNQAISAGILLMQGLVCIGCVLRRIRRGMPTPSTTSVYDKVDKQARIFLGALVIDLIIAGLCLQGGSGSEIAVYVFLCIYATGLVAFFYRGWRLMGTNVFSLIVPIAAVTVNIFIMASLGWLAFCIVLAYFVAGSVIYFGYGIRHSTMNGLRLSEVDGLDVEMDDIIKMASRSIDGDSGVGGDDKGLNDTLN
ncbi:Proline-specific permease proY, putative [Perkinsus marinus ATCC 50983]|uniref:Proline-specific permease proY, putative n=1 Tax=Perkinsus marinus (strain ATCC 50983 / TXsc) TaxID=423536 RepID=C5KZ23_PERM5|nr:Proline-specific permease proY, putative [Perkinsus marinus ATCC 50983]EER10270.1 Proline-specific permease proY, putative [Perkinsus marinus ATCC 50983]|eukprot:XP_002778475.1 Proline-specific permease proY, putative [Perkinsus marinus ATCC 50983]